MKKIFLLILLFPFLLNAQTYTIRSVVNGDNVNFYRGGTKLNTAGSSTIVINPQTGTSYTLVLADNSKLITLSNSAAITLTVPPNSSVAFPIGTSINIVGINTGQVSVAEGSGVSVESAGDAKKLRVQYSTATLIKIATDTWILVGDITT